MAVQEMPTLESVCGNSIEVVNETACGLTFKGVIRQRELKAEGLRMTLRYIEESTPSEWTALGINQLSALPADRISLHTQLCHRGQTFASLQHRRSENKVSYYAAVDDGPAWGPDSQLITQVAYFIAVPAPQHADSQASSLQFAVVRQAHAMCVGDSYQLQEAALTSAEVTAISCKKLQCTLAVGTPSCVGDRRGPGQADSQEVSKLYFMRCENLSRLR